MRKPAHHIVTLLIAVLTALAACLPTTQPILTPTSSDALPGTPSPTPITISATSVPTTSGDTIRTITMRGKSCYLQAGGGIVADSDPTYEYNESLNKAKALAVAVEQAEQGL